MSADTRKDGNVQMGESKIDKTIDANLVDSFWWIPHGGYHISIHHIDSFWRARRETETKRKETRKRNRKRHDGRTTDGIAPSTLVLN